MDLVPNVLVNQAALASPKRARFRNGVDYFGARYFNGPQGSSPDRMNMTDDQLLSPSSTLNKYPYAANNPLRFQNHPMDYRPVSATLCCLQTIPQLANLRRLILACDTQNHDGNASADWNEEYKPGVWRVLSVSRLASRVLTLPYIDRSFAFSLSNSTGVRIPRSLSFSNSSRRWMRFMGGAGATVVAVGCE